MASQDYLHSDSEQTEQRDTPPQLCEIEGLNTIQASSISMGRVRNLVSSWNHLPLQYASDDDFITSFTISSLLYSWKVLLLSQGAVTVGLASYRINTVETHKRRRDQARQNDSREENA